MIIKIVGNKPEHVEDHAPVGVSMWYDRHYRHWVLYPIDTEGNQLREASYAFGKAEALNVKKDIEEEISSGNRNGWYY